MSDPAKSEIPPGLEKVTAITGAEIVSEDHTEFPKVGGDQATPQGDPAAEDGASPPSDSAPPPSDPAPKGDTPEKKAERERWQKRQEKKRGRGRPLGSKGAAKFADIPPEAKEPIPGEPEKKTFKLDNRKLAESIFSTWVNLMVGIFGPEWLPREAPPGSVGVQHEAETIVEPMIAWLDTFVVAICTPLQMLSFSVAMYSIQRISHPNTRAKILGFFKGAWRGLMYLFRGKRPERERPAPKVVFEEGRAV
jgi:hypothetical protein